VISATVTRPSESAHRSRTKPLTAFVFAGGASLGAMQAGMLHALYERGIAADLLVGTSAGALNAAFVATRPQTVATAEQLAGVWRGLHRDDIFPISPRLVIGGLLNHSDHLVPDSGLRRIVKRYLEIDRIEQADIPLHLVSFDVLAGEEVRLSTGSALDGVLAAAAIPGVLPAVRDGGRILVDGGVVNNTPISHAIELGARRIYTLGSYDPLQRGLPAAPHGALDAAVHAFTLLTAARDKVDLDLYATVAELIVLPAANPEHVLPTDFDHADELIHHALLAARHALDEGPTRASIRSRRAMSTA
jgi:NTE family protein